MECISIFCTKWNEEMKISHSRMQFKQRLNVHIICKYLSLCLVFVLRQIIVFIMWCAYFSVWKKTWKIVIYLQQYCMQPSVGWIWYSEHLWGTLLDGLYCTNKLWRWIPIRPQQDFTSRFTTGMPMESSAQQDGEEKKTNWNCKLRRRLRCCQEPGYRRTTDISPQKRASTRRQVALLSLCATRLPANTRIYMRLVRKASVLYALYIWNGNEKRLHKKEMTYA